MEELLDLQQDPATRDSVLMTTLGRLVTWARRHSTARLTLGMACCSIDMPGGALARAGLEGTSEVAVSPRHADLMLVAGPISAMIAPRVRMLYEQMPEPRHVVAIGACACGGGPFALPGSSVVPGLDLVIPVDVHVPGCPPETGSLIAALLQVRDLMRRERLGDRRRSTTRPALRRSTGRIE